MDPIIFNDLEPIRIPVRVLGKWYALCEASEKVATEYQNASISAVNLNFSDIDATSPTAIQESLKKNVKGFDVNKMGTAKAILIAGCLFECTYDEAAGKITEVGDNVPASLVESWPSRYTKVLFEKAKEISELDKLPANNPFQLAEQKFGIGS